LADSGFLFTGAHIGPRITGRFGSLVPSWGEKESGSETYMGYMGAILPFTLCQLQRFAGPWTGQVGQGRSALGLLPCCDNLGRYPTTTV